MAFRFVVTWARLRTFLGSVAILQQNTPQLYVFASSPDDLPLAQRLAARLDTTVRDAAPDCDGGFLVEVQQGVIRARQNTPGSAPVTVEFTRGRNAHRQRFGGGINQHLCRAVGLNKHPGLHIVDANGGFARDAFVMASFGAHVTLLEQSNLLCEMICHALESAATAAESAEIASRIKVVNTDSVDYLMRLPALATDVVYLDPMFPERRKSAAVKKDMQLLHALAGPDTSAAQLLAAALYKAKRRVVVKRPVHADPISPDRLTGEVRATHTRYDIYAPWPAD